MSHSSCAHTSHNIGWCLFRGMAMAVRKLNIVSMACLLIDMDWEGRKYRSPGKVRSPVAGLIMGVSAVTGPFCDCAAAMKAALIFVSPVSL
jgi:hypothetical protein